MSVRFRIVEVYGHMSTHYKTGEKVYKPYYSLETRPSWWPLWFNECRSDDITDLKKRARDIAYEQDFKKKVLVSGTIEDIMAWEGV